MLRLEDVGMCRTVVLSSGPRVLTGRHSICRLLDIKSIHVFKYVNKLSDIQRFPYI